MRLFRRRKSRVSATFDYVAPHVVGTIWYAPWYGGDDNMAFMPGEDPPESSFGDEYAQPIGVDTTSTLFMTMWSNGTYEYNMGCGLILVPKDDALGQYVDSVIDGMTDAT